MRLTLVLPAFIILTSCSLYRPKVPIPAGVYQQQMLKDVSQPDLLTAYHTMPEATPGDLERKVLRRNQILQELIWLVDLNYGRFEAHYYGSDAAINLTGDLISLTLTGVSSVAGTAELKSVLSAITTGTLGAKSSYLKNFYDQQTRTGVVQKMRSLRATQLSLIQDERHMRAGATEYSLEAGLSDIDAYYNAGTVIGALQGIAESAAIDQASARQKQAGNSRHKQAIH